MIDASSRPLAVKWAVRVLHALAPGSRGTDGGPAVVQVMGRLVSLDAQPAPARPRTLTPEQRSGLLATWAHSGHLTYGEAELLMALDESTAWEH